MRSLNEHLEELNEGMFDGLLGNVHKTPESREEYIKKVFDKGGDFYLKTDALNNKQIQALINKSTNKKKFKEDTKKLTDDIIFKYLVKNPNESFSYHMVYNILVRLEDNGYFSEHDMIEDVDRERWTNAVDSKDEITLNDLLGHILELHEIDPIYLFKKTNRGKKMDKDWENFTKEQN